MKLSPQGQELRAKTGLRTNGRKRQRGDRAGSSGSSSSERCSNLLHRGSPAGDRKRPQEGPCRPQPAERRAAALRAVPRSPAAPAPRRPPLPVRRLQAAPRLRSRPGAAPAARSLTSAAASRPAPPQRCLRAAALPAQRKRDGEEGRQPWRNGKPRPRSRRRRATSCSSGPCESGGAGLGSALCRRGDGAGRRRAVRPFGALRCVGERRSGSGSPQERLGRNLPPPARLVLRESGMRARIATSDTAAVFQNPGSSYSCGIRCIPFPL